MTDIALQQREDGTWDLALEQGDLATDDTLRTAVVVSLFTDARAEPDDGIPAPKRRGWWADTWPLVAGDEHGSKLWLVSREKVTEELLREIEDYVEAALLWLVEDEVATGVAATAERVHQDAVRLTVDIMRPDEESMQLAFEPIWRATTNAL